MLDLGGGSEENPRRKEEPWLPFSLSRAGLTKPLGIGSKTVLFRQRMKSWH